MNTSRPANRGFVAGSAATVTAAAGQTLEITTSNCKRETHRMTTSLRLAQHTTAKQCTSAFHRRLQPVWKSVGTRESEKVGKWQRLDTGGKNMASGRPEC